MIGSRVYLVLTRTVGITFASLIMCSALSSAVAILISTKNILKLCSSINLKAFERE